MTDISELKKRLLLLSDKEILALIRPEILNNSARKECKNNTDRWFDKDACGLSKEGLEQLNEMEKMLKNPRLEQNVDRKLLRYCRALKKMRIEVPDFFREEVNPRKMYDYFCSFSMEHDIPKEIVHRVVPLLVSYIETGHMRPIMFVGEKGCGKTTAARLLLEAALSIPTLVVKVPQLSGGHGMTGDCGSFRAADAGVITKARLRFNSIVFAILFDEIDKVVNEYSRASVDDELLSITDDSNSDIYDNYLESIIVWLEHCPIIFTANDLSKVNPLLVDRCAVIKFPNATADRIKSIARKYITDSMKSRLYNHIELNYNLLDKSIDNLIRNNVTSIRKHQQVIEVVLQDALKQSLSSDVDITVAITEDMFMKAEEVVIGTERNKIGFAS